MPGLVRRFLAAATAALAVAAGVPAPATAQDLSRVAPETEKGATLRLDGGEAATTSLYRLTVDGDGSVQAYCADISTSVNSQAAYAEAEWGSGTAPQADSSTPGAVAWITENSYPNVGMERLREESGVRGIGRRQAIAATQAAIWHRTNGVELKRGSERGPGNAAQITGLYDYLVRGARAHTGEVPASALELAPGRIEGADPDAPIGPLTVHTTSPGPVAVWVQGADDGQLTGAGGRALDLVQDGEEFFLALPSEAPAGVATVYAKVTDARIRPGRLFGGKDGVETQPLVTAGSAVSTATAAVKVDWAAHTGATDAQPDPAPSASVPATAAAPGVGGSASAAPSAPPTPTPTPQASASPSGVVVAEDRRPDGHLAHTGTWLGPVIAAGLILVAAGAAGLYLARRRRTM
ncbi:Cys-Gln thioester bond-forming surface protein [Streptomonospora salina]|uniref:TQXA domain-containing protein n=1 Tax=Streptomonospora salina TaxID=104205 RepID=A0A841E101_9ACTN|nr:thioester domain-containing protein [Streptomonospora salina]MBB5997447.1 TQXA domain-containing protein [Streptomonospora salina]